MADPKNYPISLLEVMRARRVVYEHLLPTQLTKYGDLSRALDAEVYVKHENHNPTGSFKIRGGVNLMHHLSAAKMRGVITFSTGNHGFSIAQSAKWFGIPATVVVPEGNNATKNRNIKMTGADLVEAGSTFEEAAEVVDAFLREKSFYYVHPADEPHLINGVATEFVEAIEQLPDLDAVILPIGAGSEAAAATIVLKSIKPSVEIYAVQAENSQAAYRSWKSGTIKSFSNTTFAGGFATGTAYRTPFEIYKNALADFVLLSEQEIYEGIALAAHYTRSYLEGAGASTLIAAHKLKDRLRDKTVVLQFSGCNASPDEIVKAYGLDAFRIGFTD